MEAGAQQAQRFAGLAGWLRHELPADRVTISAIEKLAGGAIQENWLINLEIGGGVWAGTRRWILRTGAPTGLSLSHDRAQEFALLQAASAAGVTVPRPVALCRDPSVLGGDFLIAGWVPGTAQGRRITRAPDLPAFGPVLARRLGTELARLHKIKPPQSGLAFLGDPPRDPARARLVQYRGALDAMEEARPVLEHALNWLEDRVPAPAETVLCHVDFRTGNYMVHDGQLTAILDWEFAAWSDPHEDIGWFCARCWRFAQCSLEAGGIAPRQDFYGGYEAEAGQRVDHARVRFWEVMAHVRWSIVALQQEHRHLFGKEPSLELALTGRMVPEIEHDLLMEMSAMTGR